MFESAKAWWKGVFFYRSRMIIKKSSLSASKSMYVWIILASWRMQISLGSCSCRVTGFHKHDWNIAQVSEKFACKTFVNNNNQVIRVATTQYYDIYKEGQGRFCHQDFWSLLSYINKVSYMHALPKPYHSNQNKGLSVYNQGKSPICSRFEKKKNISNLVFTKLEYTNVDVVVGIVYR